MEYARCPCVLFTDGNRLRKCDDENAPALIWVVGTIALLPALLVAISAHLGVRVYNRHRFNLDRAKHRNEPVPRERHR